MAEVAQSQILPAPFIEAAAKPYLEKIQEVYGKPVDVSQFMGQQFVAGPGALQTQAEGLAGGLGGFQPYLQSAGQYFGGAGQAQQAAAGMVGPQAYQAYMSPYQQDVIQATLAEYDVQAQKGLPQLAAKAIGAGAFGGGREGVQRAEYQSASDRNRAALQAQLLQQGFGQAQQLAGQAFGQQMNLAQAAPQLAGKQIAGLTTLGGLGQSQLQAQLSAQQQLAQQQAYQPLSTAQQYGSGIMGLISGYPGQTATQVSPSPTAFQNILGAGATLAGIYRAF